MHKYKPASGLSYPKVYRPDSYRLVNPINELNRLQAKIERVEKELDCVPHHDCGLEVGKPCDCAMADVYKALKEQEDD